MDACKYMAGSVGEREHDHPLRGEYLRGQHVLSLTGQAFLKAGMVVRMDSEEYLPLMQKVETGKK